MRRLATLALAAVLVSFSGGLSGCKDDRPISGVVRVSPDRGKRLLALAAREAAAIKDIDARITRQLNLADQQLNRGWKEEAQQTLGEAVTTLQSGDAASLNDHARMSGWISVSQLSRQASDLPRADAASQSAVAALRQIENPAVRCEYVMGVANELQYSRGMGEASKVLGQAGAWTQSIDDVARRRQAVVSFASALFNLDDYAAGQKMLQHEGDAAWRSETLQKLAQLAAEQAPVVRDQALRASMPKAAASEAREQNEADGSFSASPYFGRRLDYKTVFQNQSKSQTVLDGPSTRRVK